MIKVGHYKVRIAKSSLRAAEDSVLNALKDGYPLNTEVEVVHPRGRFLGKVVGWNLHGIRVSVYNYDTGKTRDWHFENVEVLMLEGDTDA